MTLVTKLPLSTWSRSSSVNCTGIGEWARYASVRGVAGATSSVGYSSTPGAVGNVGELQAVDGALREVLPAGHDQRRGVEHALAADVPGDFAAFDAEEGDLRHAAADAAQAAAAGTAAAGPHGPPCRHAAAAHRAHGHHRRGRLDDAGTGAADAGARFQQPLRRRQVVGDAAQAADRAQTGDGRQRESEPTKSHDIPPELACQRASPLSGARRRAFAVDGSRDEFL